MAEQDLLAQAQEIQRQALLKRAQDIQAQNMGAKASSTPQTPEDPTITDKAKEYAMNTLSGVGKVLGYPGGIVRAALLSGSGGMTPQNTNQDLIDALKGNAPTTQDYLKRAGVPQGATLSDVLPSAYSAPGSGGIFSLRAPEKGGPLDVSARGAAGFAGDVALDPVTYLSLGGSVAANALDKPSIWQSMGRAALRPAATAGEELGKSIYSGAFKNIDKDLVNKLGKPPISPELLQSGYVGGMKGAKDAANALESQSGAELGNIYSQASDKGATVDMLPSLNDAMKRAADMRASPHPDVKAAGYELDNLIMSYLDRGNAVPVEEAHKFAVEANKLAGKRAFSPITADTITNKDEIERAIGQGIQDQSLEAVKRTNPDLYDNLLQNNKTYSSVTNAEPSFVREINKDATKNMLSQVDAMIAGAGGGASALSHDPKALLTAAAILAAKKTAQGLNSTTGRTAAGQALYRGSKYVAPAINQKSLWLGISPSPTPNPGENR